MRRMWPEEFNFVLDNAEEVTLDLPAIEHEDGSRSEAISRQALKVRIPMEDYERIWPLAEARYRLDGRNLGKAVTLITTNPHYHAWHPADGGSVDNVTEGGRHFTTKYVVVHFLLDDVRETAAA
ncbi:MULTISPECIES: hypothetical protein [unclassified Rhizobium]|uniref:hypothetical protein n=1 Tax=unclassified Rhizobium TaxID=2613769 RepID=UPI0003A9874B|nr:MULTISPECIES: hypothetical protein [unclassified Rhizobium]MBO9122610.1 hypothetical protein [Rhizobium sp. 16-488-2b]MBO9173141.1 hypothetical protein [Rhizobium sp. 16-488-2a]MBO9192968.1 hypothetical protein [Rhizobium sp. 16-449-1b]MDM9647333.1 hypothetical protein [Rhizobium sp. S163]